MDIYTIAKEEADIKSLKKELDRKVHLDNMRKREAKMLEAFDDLGIKYEKSKWYKDSIADIWDVLDLRYDVFLLTEKQKNIYTGEMEYYQVEAEVWIDAYSIRDKYKDTDNPRSRYDLEGLVEKIVERIKNAVASTRMETYNMR